MTEHSRHCEVISSPGIDLSTQGGGFAIARISWTDELEQRLVDLVAEHGNDWHTVARLIHPNATYHGARVRYGRIKSNYQAQSVSDMHQDAVLDGKLFNERDVLEIAGYDPDEWRIQKVTDNAWGQSMGDRLTNSQFKLSVVPKEQAPTPIELFELAQQYVTPFDIDCLDDEKLEQTLSLNFPDMHFGPHTADDYAHYQSKILMLLENQYKQVLMPVLGDWFNTNDFKHRTSNDTRVQDTNIPQAWEEAILFIEPIIQKALKMSPDVRLVYVRGNHDEVTAWAFIKYLEAKYPQMEIDESLDQLKCLLVDEVATFMTHGHIKKNNLAQLCATMYPIEWSKAKTRILITGHKHTIKSEDLTGIVHYQLPAPGDGAEYERDNLYLGNAKGIHVFEYGKDKINAIYYL